MNDKGMSYSTILGIVGLSLSALALVVLISKSLIDIYGEQDLIPDYNGSIVIEENSIHFDTNGYRVFFLFIEEKRSISMKSGDVVYEFDSSELKIAKHNKDEFMLVSEVIKHNGELKAVNGKKRVLLIPEDKFENFQKKYEEGRFINEG